MTCREVKRLLRNDYSPALIKSHEIKSHARSCAKCNQELVISSLMRALVTSYGDASANEHSPWDDVRLVNRIKSRIRAVNEYRAGSWDTAIIGARRWLLAFGAMAILLLVLSGRFATEGSLDQAASDKGSRSNPNWGEELVSTNSSPNLPSDEDSDNAH
ncbi:MAG: hypothetical protein ABIU20_02650 [Blastocatellia bacterium]